MEEIQRTMNYVVQQDLFRKLSAAGEEMPTGIKKDSLPVISYKVNKCINLFYKLPVVEREESIKDVEVIVKNFNKILASENAENKKGLQSALHRVSQSILKTKPLEDPYVMWSPHLAKESTGKKSEKPYVRSVKGHVSDEQFKNSARNDLAKEIASYLNEKKLGRFECKNFVNEVLENLEPTKEEFSIETITAELIKTAKKEYAPIEVKLTEEEIKEIVKIYDRAEKLDAEKHAAIQGGGGGIFTEKDFLNIKKIYEKIERLTMIKNEYQARVNAGELFTDKDLLKIKSTNKELTKLEDAQKYYKKTASTKLLDEEGMLSISQICYESKKFNQEEKSAYEDYDQGMLHAYIESFKSNGQWQNLPLVRYRLGESNKDYKSFESAIDKIPEHINSKSSASFENELQLSLTNWNTARLRQ